ncbi:MAG: hypothetical protein OEO23_08700 [Gemmatimonadota bacterium]|nr:hypothetical protein [Gemmatimonadota bacterium]
MHDLRRLAGAALACAAFATPLAAQLPDTAREIQTHLEFLGYQVTASDSNLTAVHGAKLDVLIQSYQGGVLMQSFVAVEQNREEALPTANLLNTGAAVARFYVDADGDLAIEAWMPGEYEKARFAAFLNAWDSDTLGQFRSYSDEVRQLVN